MIFTVLGSLGGIVVFLSAVTVVVRGIFRLVNSTDENTKAIQELSEKVEKAGQRITDSEVRIAIIEDRWKHGQRLRVDRIGLHRSYARARCGRYRYGSDRVNPRSS